MTSKLVEGGHSLHKGICPDFYSDPAGIQAIRPSWTSLALVISGSLSFHRRYLRLLSSLPHRGQPV